MERSSSRQIKDGSDEHLTREPEQIQAFRDTWKHDVHSYLTYLRDRVQLSYELLWETGSLFVQIGSKNVHLVRALLDEIFGVHNALPMITIAKTSQEQTTLLPDIADYLVWYAKRKEAVKYRALFGERDLPINDFDYCHVEEPDGTRRPMTVAEQANPKPLIDAGARIYRLGDATSEGFSTHKTVDFQFDGQVFHPGKTVTGCFVSKEWRGLRRQDDLPYAGRASRTSASGTTSVAYLGRTSGLIRAKPARGDARRRMSSRRTRRFSNGASR